MFFFFSFFFFSAADLAEAAECESSGSRVCGCSLACELCVCGRTALTSLGFLRPLLRLSPRGSLPAAAPCLTPSSIFLPSPLSHWAAFMEAINNLEVSVCLTRFQRPVEQAASGIIALRKRGSRRGHQSCPYGAPQHCLTHVRHAGHVDVPVSYTEGSTLPRGGWLPPHLSFQLALQFPSNQKPAS